MNNDLPSSLMGVYGRMTGFSISGPLYLVKRALATLRPLTASASSNLKRNFLVLWLMFSTLSRAKLMNPWSFLHCYYVAPTHLLLKIDVPPPRKTFSAVALGTAAPPFT